MEALTKTPLIKADAAERLLYCVVLEPDTVDLQGDVITADEIRKVAHRYALESQTVGLNHRDLADASLVETFIAPVDYAVGDQIIRKGSWVMAIKVHSDAVWYDVETGAIDGLSIGGFGERVPSDD